MKLLYSYYAVFIVVLLSCHTQEFNEKTIINGMTTSDISTLKIGTDTIKILSGIFEHSFEQVSDGYQYLQVNGKSRIIYTSPGQQVALKISSDLIEVADDPLNNFLLNRDSLLHQYTANWNMEEAEFRSTWASEFSQNMQLIDDYFAKTPVVERLVREVKDMEYMKRAHITSNFVSFKSREGLHIDPSIYNFLEKVNIHNERLAIHVNNRNFQYFYTLAKVPENIPDSIYPFAAIDTINAHIKIQSIKEMVLKSVVERGLSDVNVDHQKLLQVYQKNINDYNEDDDPVLKTYRRIQNLQVGKPAPSSGKLVSLQGDSISFKDFDGKAKFIYVWGSWCPYCKQEIPHIKRLAEQYQDILIPISVSLDTDREKWQSYIKEHDLPGRNVLSKGRASRFEQNYLIKGTNMYFVIDTDGTIIFNNTDKPSSSSLELVLANISSIL